MMNEHLTEKECLNLQGKNLSREALFGNFLDCLCAWDEQVNIELRPSVLCLPRYRLFLINIFPKMYFFEGLWGIEYLYFSQFGDTRVQGHCRNFSCTKTFLLFPQTGFPPLTREQKGGSRGREGGGGGTRQPSA